MAELEKDRRLARLLKNDPEKGLELALRRFGQPVRTICAAILGPESLEEIEEAVANSFLALWRELDLTDRAAARENARLLRQAVEEMEHPDREIFIRRYYRQHRPGVRRLDPHRQPGGGRRRLRLYPAGPGRAGRNNAGRGRVYAGPYAEILRQRWRRCPSTGW